MWPALLAALLLLGSEPPPEARQLMEAGDRQRAAGDAAGAREAYQAAVAAFAGYAQAHEALGEMLLGEKRFAEAAREFEVAAGIEPTLALAWYNLGYAARRLGDLGRARDAWRRYLALRPEDLDAQLGLAECLRGLGEREAALEAYQAFVGMAQPMPEEAGRVERAREAMAVLRAEAAATASPGGTAAPTAATTPSLGPASSPPSPSPPPLPPAVVVVPVPAEPSAPLLVPEAPRPGRQAAALQKLRLGDRLLAEGDTHLALFAFQDAVNQDPQNAEARLKLGRVYLMLDHLPEAIEQFSLACALDPGDDQARRALEEARARLEGRSPPAGSPVIVRLPAGTSLEPPPEPAPSSVESPASRPQTPSAPPAASTPPAERSP